MIVNAPGLLMASEFLRMHVARDGTVYRVHLSPAEGPNGPELWARTIVFTRDGDGGVRSVRVPVGIQLLWLSASDLDELLSLAG